jgi:predicted nucleotide-binding protein
MRRLTYSVEKELPNGYQFRCPEGEVFVVYHTGTVTCQGQVTELSKAVKGLGPTKKGKAAIPSRKQVEEAAPTPNKRVFIVYGHDHISRDGLELVLRRMGLEPIVLANVPSAGDTIIEKLEHYLKDHGNVGFACVLLTPDDQGHKTGKQEESKYRARQNVILELGMVLAKLGRKRVAILTKSSVEHPSDISGLIYRTFNEKVEEVTNALFKDLEAAGYKPDSKGL